MRVRTATCADTEPISRVHVRSWQTSYRGIVPDGVLDSLTPDQRLPLWRRLLCGGNGGWPVFVAEEDERVVGFVSGGAEREGTPGYDGELYAIYLLEEAKGHGAGRLLFRAMADALAGAGLRSMLLWVLADNRAARGFYEHLGGVLAGSHPYEIGDVTLEEVAYGWPDLAALTAALKQEGERGA